tara:strand:- start:1012 stop:1656 length:645 start_codon:yes stop_codon:yes gene_type:complete
MDGNNRWAKKNKLNKYNGYKKGAETLIKLSNFIFQNTDTKYVSAFALSKNNLNRSKKLISIIKILLLEFLNEAINDKIYNNFNIKFIGNRNFLSNEINNKIDEVENLKLRSKKYLLIYINYSGKEDINQAAYNLYKKKSNKNINTLNGYLLTNKFPDPDLLIRTGGFSRLSDFLIYQSTFTELFFINKLWPDLLKSDLLRILNKFYKIERKFGL